MWVYREVALHVMAGLDPAIHVLVAAERRKVADARDKRGHDDVGNRIPRSAPMRHLP